MNLLSQSLLVALTVSAHTANALYSNKTPVAQEFMWNAFKKEYAKQYADAEEEKERFAIFINNLAIIDARNAAETRTAVHGITKFADLSPEEFKANFLNFKPVPRTRTFADIAPLTKGPEALVDWTGVYTTPVKYQGFCGSCWAFSAVEQIESDWMRMGGAETVLSVQQPISCVKYPKPGVGGCNGGWTENVFEYAEDGLESDFDYPYMSATGTSSSCKSDSSKYIVKVDNYTTVSASAADEPKMAAWVQSTGPLTACVDASDWSTYTGGILTACGQDVDHCVQAVGIDTAAGYWKIRNSWGTSWGEHGYIRLAYGNNTCNVASDSNYAEVSAY